MQLGLASWGLAFVGARAPEALREAARSEHPEIRTAAVAALGDCDVNSRGLALLLGAAFFFSLMSVQVKALGRVTFDGAAPLPSTMIVQSGATARMACEIPATSIPIPVTGEACRMVATATSGVISAA